MLLAWAAFQRAPYVQPDEDVELAQFGVGPVRIALALFKKHGFRLEGWPKEVRDVLALD